MTKNFQQSIDTKRPHTILTPNPMQSGSLEYRYEDTKEVVTVPNVWYNQTHQTRVALLRWTAKMKDDAADKFKRSPPVGLSQAGIDQIVVRYRATAMRIRADAARMEAAGGFMH